MELNKYLFEKIYSAVGHSSFMDAVAIFFAEYLTYFIVIGLAFWIFSKPTKKAIFSAFSFIFLSVLFSRGIITEAIRYFYKSPRPFVVLGFDPLIFDGNQSFPSGHTAFLLAIAFSVFLINKKFGIWLCVSGLLVALARIYAGVHWPFDILGGVAVALIGTFIAHFLLKKFTGSNPALKGSETPVV